MFILPSDSANGYISSSSKLTPTDISDVIDGTHRRLYIVGAATYVDVFQIKRQIEFCGSAGGQTLKDAIDAHATGGIAEGQIFEFDANHNREVEPSLGDT